MKKTLLLITIFITSIFARENPFEPVVKEYSSPVIKDRIKEYPSFSSQTISFPSKARVLKEICIKYQNVDGSIEEKKIKIDKEIEWQEPLLLTKKSSLKKESSNPPSINKSKEQKTKKRQTTKTIKLNPFCTISIKDKKIFIKTSDKKIRSFMLIKPYKVVLDFKNLNDVESKTFIVNTPHIKKVVLGNHKGYYRVVFELNGHYGFTIKKSSNGYILLLK